MNGVSRTLLLGAALATAGCSGAGGTRGEARLPPPPQHSGPIGVDELLARARGEPGAEHARWSITLRYRAGELQLPDAERRRLQTHIAGLPGDVLQAELLAGPAAGRQDPAAGFRAMLRLRELADRLPDGVAVRSARYLPSLPRDALRVILSPAGSEPRA